ncbi:MAG: SpoIIE family protein phosphatase [Acidobacteriota bacterium]|nr:SpoIIE family protein phosphatase [Acidobacteriota bacterium]
MAERPVAVFLVLAPSGQRSRVPLDVLPFTIGRQSGNSLVLRDNRTSRNHSRIVFENGNYVVEDLNSRHGTWVNGKQVARHILRNSDRIEFGVKDSYQLTFSVEKQDIQRLLKQFGSTSPSVAEDHGADNLIKLRSLVEVARALQNSLSTKEVLTAVVDAALAVTRCERGFLLLRPESDKNADLDVTVARDNAGRELEAEELRVPRHLIRRALASRRDLLSMTFDPFEEQGLRPEMTVAQLELRSVVCLPLIRLRSGAPDDTRAVSAMEDTVGLIYMDSRITPADLSSGTRELLQTLAIEASTILENARLIEEERGKIRMEDELRLAREIQQGLQPSSMPQSGWFRAAGSSSPSTQVGGDYFDVRQNSPTSWTAVVADVSGKGVGSALLASLLQGTFLMASGDPEHIAPRMARLNEFLLQRTRGEKYATVFYCIVEASGLLSYSNAGHCAPFLLGRDGRLQKLNTTSMPVGMLEEAPFQMVQRQLTPGDKIVIFSDGLTEAEGADGTFFDSDRLRKCLRENAPLDAIGLHAALLEAVNQFTEGGIVRDDITALVVEYSP